MPQARINGINLYYEEHGNGPALIFAHGAGGNHLSWWQQVPEFLRSFRCVTFDHRLFGDSRDEPGGPGPRAFVEDLRQLLGHLGIDKAAIVAQSMGGWTALGFAANYPERVSALVLCDTTAGIDNSEVARGQQDAVRGLAPGGLGQDLSPVYAKSFPESDPARCFLYQQIFALNRHVPPTLIKELFAVRHRVDRLVERRVPTLLVVGAEDVLAPPKVMKLMTKAIPHAQLIEVAGAGHSVYFERPAEFNRIVMDFLRAHAVR
jgi:3-oxoadipate enol-lactonase